MSKIIFALTFFLVLAAASLADTPAATTKPSDPPASKEVLSARIVIPADSKLDKGEFAASLELTNNSDKPLRVVTRCVTGNGMSKDGRFSHAYLTPKRWNSESPEAEELAKSTVELSPSKSVTLPFHAVCKGSGKVEISAEYKVTEESVPSGQNIWTGRAQAKVKLDVSEDVVKVAS